MRRIRGGRKAAIVFLAGTALVSTSLGLVGGIPAHAAGVNTATVVVGAIASEEGSTNTTQDVPNALSRWQTYVNSTGGIGGHHVKVIVMNDNNDPALSLTEAQTLVNQDHAVAILDQSSADQAFEKFVDSRNIPVISENESAGTFTYLSDKNYFADGTTVLAILWGTLQAARSQGAHNFGIVYCTDVSACAQAVPVLKGDAKALGMVVGYTAGASDSAPDYTAQCEAAQQAGVQALFPAGVGVTRMADDCARQGYHPIWIGSEGTINATAAADPNLNGAISDQQGFPWFINTTKATKLFHQVMGSYLAHAESPGALAADWTGAQMFGRALQLGVALTPRQPVTAHTIYDGLYAFHGETLGGITSPLTFSRTMPNQVNCWFLVGVHNKRYYAPRGLTPQCEPASASSSS